MSSKMSEMKAVEQEQPQMSHQTCEWDVIQSI